LITAPENDSSAAKRPLEAVHKQDESWRSVVAELKKGSRITGSERDKLSSDLRKKYEAGQSIRLLAESSGRSYGFVHRILSESGTTLRGRGGATRGKKKA
jgi:hypothetical protein